jgi:hypothetical protein
VTTSVKWLGTMPWSFPNLLFFDGRLLLRGAVAQALMLIVVLAQPVASLAWLGGVHATIEQATLHEEAVEHGHHDHHGVLQHHEHLPSGSTNKTDSQFSGAALGPIYATAATYSGPLHELLQATLTMPPDSPSPDSPPLRASLAQAIPSQHSPPVPHRPPIFFS